MVWGGRWLRRAPRALYGSDGSVHLVCQLKLTPRHCRLEYLATPRRWLLLLDRLDHVDWWDLLRVV